MIDLEKKILENSELRALYETLSPSEKKKHLLSFYAVAKENESGIKSKIIKTSYGLERVFVESENAAPLDLMFINDKEENFINTKVRSQVALKIYKTLAENKGLFICGDFGCGKTYLALSFLRKKLKEGKTVLGIYYPDFVRFLKSTFELGTTESYVSKLKTVDVLLIDDIGAENNSSYLRDEILNPVLQHRMDNELLTIFTSNFDLDGLEKHFTNAYDKLDTLKAGRLMARIKSMSVVINLSGETNFRRSKK